MFSNNRILIIPDMVNIRFLGTGLKLVKQNTLFDSTEKTIASFSGMKLFMLSHIVALVSVSFSTILLVT